jgi:hypothetical protein
LIFEVIDMHMRPLLVSLFVCASAAACGGTQPQQAPAEQAAPAPSPAAAAAKPHGTLLQVMRAIDFPNSNIIFDTQTTDPAAPAKPGDASGSASAQFGGLYGGWEKVENASIALAESATLIMMPGRTCSNGKPVPIENEDWKKFAQLLADSGMASYKAAQAKSLDQMMEVSGTVADACAQCHEVYRDRGRVGSPERCTAAPAAAAGGEPPAQQ